MNPSPLRNLVARHVCACRVTAGRLPASSRLLSTSNAQKAADSSTPTPTFGSAEFLKRRYQRDPPSKSEQSAEQAEVAKRMRYSAYGIALCTLAIFGTIYAYPDPQQQKNPAQKQDITHFDAPPSIPGIPDTSVVEHAEQVPTGTSTIPTFPRTIHISPDKMARDSPGSIVDPDVEYHLVGLGIRTVSFLNIQVYVVGLYIAVADIAKLQERLIRTVDPVATTLVPGEKGKLRDLLLDPVQGEQIWNHILQDGGIRTAFRIVPTRNTDVMHMRDGFVRGITARSAHFANDLSDATFADDSFGQSLNDFKTVFGGTARKKIPWGETLLLTRDGNGVLEVVLEDKAPETGSTSIIRMGTVRDERVSRLLWLNYLAGKNVSSEPARRSVIEGVMEYVARPVGTVEEMVV